MADNFMRCEYCKDTCQASQGVFSEVIANLRESDFVPWYCSITCAQMVKFELGKKDVMTLEIYDKMLSTVYKKLGKHTPKEKSSD